MRAHVCVCVRACVCAREHALGARGGAVGCTVLQAGRSRVRFPMVSLEFFIDIILSVILRALGSTEPGKEMSTRNISGGKSGRRVPYISCVFQETLVLTMLQLVCL